MCVIGYYTVLTNSTTPVSFVLMTFEARSGVPIPDIEFFQQMADGAPVLIWMSGTDMGCFYFNREWLDYRGRTMAQEYGNGWAEGVHPEDLERCVQHYIGSFERRTSFAMSYRLMHHTGEYRWILDRGVPHYGAGGQFLGYYGGCAETPVEASVTRIAELRKSLNQMRHLAERFAKTESLDALHSMKAGTLQGKTRDLVFEHQARAHAAVQIEQLAVAMLTHDRIPNGVCLSA
jgi:PAS domain S-box-containing protein